MNTLRIIFLNLEKSLNMNMIMATVGAMKFYLREFYLKKKISNILYAWQERGPVRLRIVAVSGDMIIFFRSCMILNMKNMKVWSNG